MAAMTYTDLPEIRQKSGRDSYPLVDDFDGFAQGFVGLLAGVLVKWADTVGIQFIGLLLDFENSGTGVTDAADPDVPEGRVNQNGDTLVNLPVAGVTAQTDVGFAVPVYCATDNWRTDLSLTPTSNSGPVGWLSRFRAAGRGDVTLFTPEQAALQA